MKTLPDFLLAIERGALVNIQNEEGTTALHYAVLEQNKEKASAFIISTAIFFSSNYEKKIRVHLFTHDTLLLKINVLGNIY